MHTIRYNGRYTQISSRDADRQLNRWIYTGWKIDMEVSRWNDKHAERQEEGYTDNYILGLTSWQKHQVDR